MNELSDLDKLNQLVTLLLEHDSTIIDHYHGENQEGFKIKNVLLNIQTTIFSDTRNRVYFEFNFLNKNNITGISNPIYKIENINDVKPLLDKILHSMNAKNGIYSSDDSMYIAAFRSFLRGEKTKEAMHIQEEKYHFGYLDETGRECVRMHKDDISSATRWLEEAKEPTSLITLKIKTRSNYNATFYVPKYAHSEYPLLQPKFIEKCPDATTSFDAVIKSLNSYQEVPQTQVQDLLLYLALKEDVSKKDNAEGMPRKLKI